MIDTENRIQLKFQGKEDLPAWAITHYLQQTEINYIKIVLVQRICNLIADGLDPDKLLVASSSADVFPKKAISYEDFNEFEVLARKGESTSEFWRIISRHHRPVVFYESNNSYVPIYSYEDGNALIIRNVGVNSPVSLNLEGVPGAVTDLYYAGEREQRQRLQWENEQVGQTVRNVEDIARASETVNRPGVHPGVRTYANTILEQALKRQEKLNQEIGMTNAKISKLA